MHRGAHALYRRGLRLPARLVSQVSRFLTGIEIHPGAQIGPGFFIDHGMGVVIGETTEIGEDVTLYQGVTLGGTGKDDRQAPPHRADGVIVGTGARVLGPVVLGEGAKVGAGAIVIKDVPPNSTVVGNPGRPVIVDGQRVPRDVHHPDIDHVRLPDPVAEAMACLVRRVSELERDLADVRAGRTPDGRIPTPTRTACRRAEEEMASDPRASTPGPASSRPAPASRRRAPTTPGRRAPPVGSVGARPARRPQSAAARGRPPRRRAAPRAGRRRAAARPAS